MNPVMIAAIYFILFWLCFLAVLSHGVQSVEEAGDGVDQGHDRGAPVKANLLRKALWAAGGALVLLLILVGTLQILYFGKPLG